MNRLRHRMKPLDPILKPPEFGGQLLNYNNWQSLRLSIASCEKSVTAMQVGYNIVYAICTSVVTTVVNNIVL